MDLWDAIGFKEPYILACTGAGGKTSALLSLVNDALFRNVPVLLSTTTMMYYSQVIGLNPIFSNNFNEGASRVAHHLTNDGLAAWFMRMDGDKVIGVPPQWLDRMEQSKAKPYIFVEADGARGLWLKASEIYEPVIPSSTQITVGVLNLQAIGQPLSTNIVHRLELVLALLQKQQNEIVGWRDLALLALHERGIFQHSQGSKILLLTGSSTIHVRHARQIAEYLGKIKAGIHKCIVTEGFGEALRPIEVYDTNSIGAALLVAGLA